MENQLISLDFIFRKNTVIENYKISYLDLKIEIKDDTFIIRICYYSEKFNEINIKWDEFLNNFISWNEKIANFEKINEIKNLSI